MNTKHGIVCWLSAISIIFVLCQCGCRQNDTEMCKEVAQSIYYHEDDYQGMDIHSVTLLEEISTNSHDKGFSIRINIDEGSDEPTSYCSHYYVDLKECDIANLNIFLDSCLSSESVSDKVLYCDFNETDGVRCCLGILAFKTAECSYVDLQISPQKLKIILEKAEKMIAEEKRRDGKAKDK